MKHKTFGGLDAPEIQRQLQESQEQLFRLRFQMGMGQTEGLKKYRTLRKERARMLTVLRAKELAGEKIAPLVTAKPAAPQVKEKRKGGLAGLFQRKKK